jgi:hypothetical protein
MSDIKDKGRRTKYEVRTAAPGLFFVLCTLSFVLILGCAPYQLGNGTLYPADVQTVYVPMFESDSFRRNLGERLTEAVQKEIELKTPYKVVATPSADSILTGRIKDDTKHTLVKNKFDDPREVEVGMTVEVHWLNRKGDLIGQCGTIPIPSTLTEVSETATLVPEYGQSTTTAQQQVIERLATQIVGMMEAPW